MNKKQKFIILVGVIVIAIMTLFPPFYFKNRKGHKIGKATYGFILLPPQPIDVFLKLGVDDRRVAAVVLNIYQLGAQIAAVVIITAGLVFVFSGKKNSQEKQADKQLKVNRGFKRITFVLSFLVLAFFVAVGIERCLIGGYVEALWEAPLIGLIFFTGIWVIYYVIYYIGGYIVKGFRDDKPKDEQKQ